MNAPIMPQGTAVWLIENTALTFEQIAKFCHLHVLEVQALADDQVCTGMIGVDPIKLGQLTQAEIDRCSKDPNSELQLSISMLETVKVKNTRKYTPLAKRKDRPDAILWILKYYPNMPDAKICSLISTTKTIVKSIREKTYSKMAQLTPKDPVLLGLCSQIELDAAISELTQSEG